MMLMCEVGCAKVTNCCTESVQSHRRISRVFLSFLLEIEINRKKTEKCDTLWFDYFMHNWHTLELRYSFFAA